MSQWNGSRLATITIHTDLEIVDYSFQIPNAEDYLHQTPPRKPAWILGSPHGNDIKKTEKRERNRPQTREKQGISVADSIKAEGWKRANTGRVAQKKGGQRKSVPL